MMPSALRKCVELSRSTLVLPLLFFPAGARTHLFACYQLLRTVDDDVDAQSNEASARERADYWCAQLDAAHSGAACDPAMRRAGTAIASDRTRALLANIFRALPDQSSASFETLADLEDWAARQNGPLGELILESLGLREPWTRPYARRLAVAFQLVNVLKDIPEDRSAGRVLLPRDELATVGLTVSDVLASGGGAPLEDAARRLAVRARHLLAEAEAIARSSSFPELAHVELWTDLYRDTLLHLEALGFSTEIAVRHLPLSAKLRRISRWYWQIQSHRFRARAEIVRMEKT